MNDIHKFFRYMSTWPLVLVIVGCSTGPVTPVPAAPTATSPVPATSAAILPSPLLPELVDLWVDATLDTIRMTQDWSNKVELADINGDGLVDLLFANGGDYDTPGTPDFSRVFINRGPGQKFNEATMSVFGSTPMLARVIKARDLNGDEFADIMVGTTFQTQSRLYLGDGSGNFTEVTTTHLPQMKASIGDLEFGDVDGDGDLDIVLADWAAGSPMDNEGGHTMLWLNDGTGHFSDETAMRMPDVLVKFSWELEFVDIDNDYDLDILVSCKMCTGSFLFLNDSAGNFTDATAGRLPQFNNNYDFEAMDLDGDGYLDLVTINDGFNFTEHLFLNNQHGGFEDATEQFWPTAANVSYDDNNDVFLDYDSDGDADFIISSLNGPDRLLINDGTGHLSLAENIFTGPDTPGTLGLALADLNGDHKLDVVQAQGENPDASDERVFFGKDIKPDKANPVISLVEQASASTSGQPLVIRARVHDNKSPTMPQDWQSVKLIWKADGKNLESEMIWYGEYLWRGMIEQPSPGSLSYQVCATDAAGNKVCSELLSLTVE